MHGAASPSCSRRRPSSRGSPCARTSSWPCGSGAWAAASASERAEALLRSVHLEGFADKQPFELSGGMRQRVAIARAFAQDADVLLMDEPFGALDAMTRDLLHDELEPLWRDRTFTVLFVTHNVREAVRLGDRVVLLSSRPGRVVEEFRGRRRPSPTHRGPRRLVARRRDHRPPPGGGAPPCPLTPPSTTSPSSVRSSPASTSSSSTASPERAGPGGSGRRRGRSSSPSPSRCSCGRWSCGRAGRTDFQLAPPSKVFPQLWEDIQDGDHGDVRSASRTADGARLLPGRSPSASLIGVGRVAFEDPAQRCRVA